MTQDEMTSLFNMGIAVGRQLDTLNRQIRELQDNKNETDKNSAV